jgi:NAD(P)H dehydrogenase (quinone)
MYMHMNSRPTAHQERADGEPDNPRNQRTDHRSKALQRHGAEIFTGSLNDIGDVRRALSGVRRAYFCAPLLPGCLNASVIFASAAQEQELEAIVVMSQWLADPGHASVHTRETWLADAVFARVSGVAVITINPGWFADNYMAVMEPAAQFGLMPMPLGSGLNAPPSNEDIARVIVGALTDPARHAGKTYRPTGPRLLSPQDIAADFAKALGRPVKYVDAPIKVFSKVAKAMGFPEFVIAQVQWYFKDYQRNAFGVGAPTSAVLEVGGQAPEGFDSIVRRYVASSPFARRSIGGRVKAMAGLTRAMLMRAPELGAYDRRCAPRPSRSTLAADSADWLATHDPRIHDPRIHDPRIHGPAKLEAETW